MNPTPEEIWSKACEQPYGLRISTDDPTKLHQVLVAFRATSANAELYQFTLQTKGEEVWLVRSSGLPEVRVDGQYKPLEE